ncbi:MAG: endonuclease/exonuclease/phosphatase family protein [Planctomycetia bacterium]|nr:endonuclease/exonuclease/phosphatase family protein [Planctomycetia bacterium]
MRKIMMLLLLAMFSSAAVYVHQNYEIVTGDHFAIKPRAATTTNTSVVQTPGMPGAPDAPGGVAHDTIRVGSFNIQIFGTSKAAKPRVMQVLCEVARGFDVLAIQEVRCKDDTLLPRFVEQINANGAHYDYVIGPRLGKSVSKEQYAFIFNADTIEIDRSATYTVADPDQLLQRSPLVAMFRARGPPADKAFTFKLVDIHTSPQDVKHELDVLSDVYRAVLHDGRNEDDVILLGDLNASEHELGKLGQVSGITWAIADTATNTRRNKSYDNMLFMARETNEYTGRSGVVDVLRQFNLTTEQALEVSDHLPIWAEFSVYEGGNRGRVAALPTPSKN